MKLERIFLDRESLGSQIIQDFVGEKTFDSLASLQSSQSGSVISKIFKGIFKFTGFLLKSAFSFIDWSFSGLWELIVESTYELAYFDWNSTDKEIQQEIEQNNQQIIQRIGGLVGSGSVWLSTLAISSGLSIKFPVLAGRIALEIAKEGGNDLRGQLANLLSSSTQSLLTNIILSTYTHVRGEAKEKNSKNGKPWILAEKVEEKIQKIQNKSVKSFTTGFLDGFLESIIEVGYVISFTLDDFYEAAREAQSNQSQPLRTIEILPDGEDSDEKIEITDTQDNLEVTLNNYLSTHQLIRNRDVATVVGQPYDDWYQLNPQPRKIMVIFKEKEKPPYVDETGRQVRQAQISIPDAKVLSWNQLKNIKKFTWGKYQAKGVFDNRRFMIVHGNSESEAEETLKSLAELSNATLGSIRISSSTWENKRRKKQPTVMYPCYVSVIVRKATVASTDTTTIDGKNLSTARHKINLWEKDPPDNLKDLFKY